MCLTLVDPTFRFMLRGLSFTFLVITLFSCTTKDPYVNLTNVQVPAGFKVEKLYSPSDSTHGSWVSLAHIKEDQFVASDQYGLIYRIRIPAVESNEKEVIVSPLEIDGLGKAQGLLWAFNSLYVMVNDRDISKSGLYRLTDTDDDQLLDNVQFMQQLDGWGEHGPHAVVKGPDDLIYVIAGNHTKLPDDFTSRQPVVWEEDNLTEPLKDPNGHAVSIKAPGGWIARTDPEGSYWEVYSSGYRNPYDMAFNEFGDLFTFDSDMEWDLGLPWYRPVRVCHATSGSEYGWRTGSGKWPDYYPDNLPGVHEVGQGSPTGVVSALGSSFPAPFDKGLFICDWSFGTMYHVTLEPKGATYTSEQTEFLSGVPLPLTDVVFDDQGYMYFTTGGRRLESGLYRVWYDGSRSSSKSSAPTEEHQLRRALEVFHDPEAEPDLDLIWDHLAHSDRFVRYSARIALEKQGVERWESRLDEEDHINRLVAFGLAAARTGDRSQRKLAFEKLSELETSGFEPSGLLDLIRAQGLLIIRDEQLEPSAIESQWIDLYPSKDAQLNRELAFLFAETRNPEWARKTFALLDTITTELSEITIDDSVAERSEFYGPAVINLKKRTPAARKIDMMHALSTYSIGWSEEIKEAYFTSFNGLWDREGGYSYRGFLQAILDQALSQIPKNERDRYRDISGSDIGQYGTHLLADLPVPQGPGKNWTVQEVVDLLESESLTPDMVNGAKMFEAALCKACHVFKGEGGSIGPDLSQLGTRFTTKDMAKAIIDPGQEVTDQYATSIFELSNGDQVHGKLVRNENDTLSIMENPLMPGRLRHFPKSEVLSIETSTNSWMFPALLNRLNEQEVYDLMVYLKGN